MKASTRPWGSRRTNPTVSVRRTGSPPGSASRRVVGSRVAKSRSRRAPRRRQPVEQRRLAGVRVAHDRDVGETAPAAAPALELPVALQIGQVVLQAGDATGETATIGLQLRLARALPGADPAALLGQPALGAPPESGQAVLQQGQLDLGPSLEGVRVLGEDVQDHRGALDGGPAQQLLEVVLLRRRQVVGRRRPCRRRRPGRGSRSSSAFPRPTNVDGSGRSRRCSRRPTTSAPAVSTSSSSSSSSASVLVEARRWDRDPDEHDLLVDPPLDQRGAQRLVIAHVVPDPSSPTSRHSSTSTAPTNVAGPIRVTRPGSGSSRRTLASPPSMCTVISPAAGSAKPQPRRPPRPRTPRSRRLR